MESSSRIPFSTRAKNITVNSIRGLNFDDISTDTLIKKIDANNAGNSNIKNSFTATGSVTQLLNGDPNGLITNIGGEIITSLIGADAKMELTVGEAGGKRSIILQENQAIVIEDNLSVTGDLNSNSLSVTNGIAAKDITTTGLIQGYNLHASAGITGTTITSSAAMNANSLSVTNGIATTDITATGLVQGNTVAAIGSLIINGTVNLNGSTGNSGELLTSNGSSDPTWSPPAIPTPYYIELDIGDSGGGAIYSSPATITTTINTLTALSSPIPYYNSDLINSSTWSPSVAGLYLINYKALIRSVNADYLVEATTALLKKQANGIFTNININNVRNWGSSVNETDARVFTMTLPLTTTVYANIGDEFRFTFYGRSYFNNAIWLLTNPDTSNISITKLA